MNTNKYEYMNNFENNWWFYDESIRVPDDDIDKILPLSKIYSQLLWERYISKTNRHLTLLDKDELPPLQKVEYNWRSDWNAIEYERMRNILRKNLSYNDEDVVLIFYMKEISIETTWHVFLNHWINFLFEDEGVVLVNEKSDDIVVFSNDFLFIGKRNNI